MRKGSGIIWALLGIGGLMVAELFLTDKSVKQAAEEMDKTPKTTPPEVKTATKPVDDSAVGSELFSKIVTGEKDAVTNTEKNVEIHITSSSGISDKSTIELAFGEAEHRKEENIMKKGHQNEHHHTPNPGYNKGDKYAAMTQEELAEEAKKIHTRVVLCSYQGHQIRLRLAFPKTYLNVPDDTEIYSEYYPRDVRDIICTNAAAIELAKLAEKEDDFQAKVLEFTFDGEFLENLKMPGFIILK